MVRGRRFGRGELQSVSPREPRSQLLIRNGPDFNRTQATTTALEHMAAATRAVSTRAPFYGGGFLILEQNGLACTV